MSAPPRLPGTVAWVDLSTPDPDAAAGFYAGLLGWQIDAEDTPMGRYVIGLVDGEPAAGMMAPAPEAAGVPPAWNVYVSVADIDATWAQAIDAGATGLQPPMEVPGGDRIAVLTDPAGAVVGLMQPTPEGSMIVDAAGAVAWIETDSRDRATSRRFYEQLFGWTASEDADADYTVFGQGGTDVAGLMDMPPGVPDEVPSYWLVYFAVDDVDDAVARTRELGGTAATETMTGGGMRFAVLEDPLGAVFAVLEQTA